MSQQVESGRISVTVRNIGGIDSYETAFDPGVTVLTGRNATNRTSFLRALGGVLGGSSATLKGDADEGEVAVTVDGDRYVRRYQRHDDTVRVDGEPYTDEAAIVDVFSCLLESNPIRRAVERSDGGGLREAIMRPIDTERIKAQIEDHQEELRRIEDRLDDIGREKVRLPTLEERRLELREELDCVESELSEVREVIDEFEANADAAEAAESVVDDLRETRAALEDVRDRMGTQRRALSALEDEHEEVTAELEELTVPEEELDEAESELDRLQGRNRRLENEINNLISIVEFNEELLDGESDALLTTDSRDDDVVSGLDPLSGTVECWTCGTSVERRDIAERLDTLRDLVDEKREDRDEVRERLANLESTLSELRDSTERRDRLEDRRRDIEEEIEDRKSRIEELTEREATLEEQVDDLETEAEETEELRDSDLLERYKLLSELEYDRGTLEADLSDVTEEISAIEALIDEEAELEIECEELREELESLRTRIGDLERSAVETFNEHMATIIDLLDYDNLERVWIDRKAAGPGAGGLPSGSFDLNVVRATEGGSIYEDAIDTLSESEREVVGLVVALAGYLVHDVHRQVPIMLLDSLEAIDADRIASLVEYFADHAPFLLVALLPEDAEAMPDDYRRRRMDGTTA